MITADQMKAGRALVGLKQDDVARSTGLSVQTIKRMETVGTERSSAGNVQAVQRALEEVGVVFFDGAYSGNGGPGVRLARPSGKSIDTDESQTIQYRDMYENDAPPGAGG